MIVATDVIARAIFGRPLMMHQAAAEALLRQLGPIEDGRLLAGPNVDRAAVGWPDPIVGRGEIVELLRTAKIGLVPVLGIIAETAAAAEMTSWQTVTQDLEQAAADPELRAIVLAIDSPGGVMPGALEALGALRRVRSVKPTLGFVYGRANGVAAALALAIGGLAIAPAGALGLSQAFRLGADRPQLGVRGIGLEVAQDAETVAAAEAIWGAVVEAVAEATPGLLIHLEAVEQLELTAVHAEALGVVDTVVPWTEFLRDLAVQLEEVDR